MQLNVTGNGKFGMRELLETMETVLHSPVVLPRARM